MVLSEVVNTFAQYLRDAKIDFELAEDDVIVVSNESEPVPLHTIILITEDVIVFATAFPPHVPKDKRPTISSLLATMNKSVMFTKFTWDPDDDLSAINSLWYDNLNLTSTPFLRTLQTNRFWAATAVPIFTSVASGLLSPEDAMERWEKQREAIAETED